MILIKQNIVGLIKYLNYCKMRNEKTIAMGIAFGLALGSIIGFLTDSFVLWISLGIALGAGIGLTMSQKSDNNKKS